MDIQTSNLALRDDYELIEGPISLGSTSDVYRMRHKDWQQDMALKLPRIEYISDPRRREDFRRECCLWVDLGLHPHIVQCYYVQEHNGETCVFSEWCSDSTLSAVIANGSLYEGTPAQQLDNVLSVALQVMLGIEYSHRCGVVHKDIKPDNILIAEGGCAKITDFGSAAASDESSTAAYRSPEQRKNLAPDSRTDIFSWAVLCVELLNKGRRGCWRDSSEVERYLSVILAECPVAPTEALSQLIADCLRTVPAERPDAAAVIQRLCTMAQDARTAERFTQLVHTSRAVVETPDSLNNRALSYLYMQQPDKADQLWKRSVAENPYHLDSLYNYNVFLWENGKIDDITLRHILTENCSHIPEIMEQMELVMGCTLVSTLQLPMSEYGCFPRFSEDGSKLIVVFPPVLCQVYDTATGCLIQEHHFPEGACTAEMLDNIGIRAAVTDCPDSDDEYPYAAEEWSVPDMGTLKICLNYDPQCLTPVLADSAGSRIIHTYRGMTDFGCLSADGKLVVLLGNNCTIAQVWTIPENRRFIRRLSRTATTESIRQSQKEFDALLENFERHFAAQEYSLAIDDLHGMERIPNCASLPELFNAKLKMLPRSTSVRLSIAKTDYYEAAVQRAQISPDGDSVMVLLEHDSSVPNDERVQIWRLDRPREPMTMYVPVADADIIDAGFDDEGRLLVIDSNDGVTPNGIVYDYGTDLAVVPDTDTDSAARYRLRTNHDIPEELYRELIDRGYDAESMDLDIRHGVLIGGSRQHREFVIYRLDFHLDYCVFDDPEIY